ncbi:MAG: hypothetical protein HZC28_08620 [Spirochaetes bacterium]|nr:hypothetical protein [Spirochaetota bacterium]
MATERPLGKKIGTAETTFLFGIPLDDNNTGIFKAAKNGGITHIATVDVKDTWWLIGGTRRYTVTGE